MSAAPSTDRLLITGVAGVVGSALAATFPPDRIMGLVHSTAPERAPFPVATGDITQPRLGLGADEYRRLAGSLGGVIHSAAATTVTLSEDHILRTNVTGTANVARLALDAGVPLYHVSTMYVRKRHGAAAGGMAVYQRSKIEAEDAAREAGATIFRPSVVIGDSRDGHIASFQGFYSALKAIVESTAPIVPVSPDSYVDFLPQDYVADCIRAAIDGGARGEFWLTAGRRAWRMEQLVDHALEFARRVGLEAPRPRMMDSEVVDRLIVPGMGDRLPADLMKRLHLFTEVAAHIVIEDPLPSSQPELEATAELPPFPDLRESLDAALDYWAAKRGGFRNRALRPVAARGAT